MNDDEMLVSDIADPQATDEEPVLAEPSVEEPDDKDAGDFGPCVSMNLAIRVIRRSSIMDQPGYQKGVLPERPVERPGVRCADSAPFWCSPALILPAYRTAYRPRAHSTGSGNPWLTAPGRRAPPRSTGVQPKRSIERC